jgi:hypothetical protein
MSALFGSFPQETVVMQNRTISCLHNQSLAINQSIDWVLYPFGIHQILSLKLTTQALMLLILS